MLKKIDQVGKAQTRTTLVGVKLTPTEVKVLDQLVLFGHFKTRSHCLRQLLFQEADSRNLQLDARAAIRLERLAHPMRAKGEADEAAHDRT
jgi:Arc/MetJ-type ribon-helix-helix transcriptional regulator